MSALPRTLLIGHGYLGSHLAQVLSGQGFPVVAVHRGTPLTEPYHLLSADLTDPASLAELAQSFSPEVVVHAASSSRGGPEAYRRVFVEGVRHLLETFPDAQLFFTSSTSVYGQTDGSLVDEHSATVPDRETGRLLLEAETLVRGAGGVVLRLAGIYGPGRSVYLQRLFEGLARIEDTEPSRYLNQIHRDDACSAIRHLLPLRGSLEGRCFNVVDDTPLTQRACYEALASRFGLPTPPLTPPDTERKRAWTHKIVSNAALRATGWSPLYPSFLDAVERDPRLVPSIRESLAGS